MSKRETGVKSATKIYAENISMEQGHALNEERKKKQLKAAAISGWAIAFLVTASAAPLLQFQHVVPATIIVDRSSGDYRVEVDKQSVVSFESPDFERRAVSDLARYVKAREGFTRGEADTNYKTVWLMSTADLRGPWDAYYKPESKESPLNYMLATDAWWPENLSFSFIPTSEPGVRVAQVRYDLVKRQGQIPTTVQRMVSTVTFKYDKGNVPTKMDDFALNAFGFEVVNYRRDDDGPRRQLQPNVGGQGNAAPQPVAMQPQAMPVAVPQAGAAPAPAYGGSSVRAGLQSLIGGSSK